MEIQVGELSVKRNIHNEDMIHFAYVTYNEDIYAKTKYTKYCKYCIHIIEITYHHTVNMRPLACDWM